MSWFLLGLISAFFAAIQFALKSRIVKEKKLDSLTGFSTYLLAALFLYIFYFVIKDKPLMIESLPINFWAVIAIHCILEVIAVLALFRAFRLSDLSYLMPLVSLTSIGSIFPAWYFFGETLSILGVIGICLAVGGAILIDYNKQKTIKPKNNKRRQSKLMLLIVFIAWSFTPVLRKEAIMLSSPATTAVILHFLIAFTFLIPFIARKEYQIMGNQKKVKLAIPKYFYLGLIAVSIAAAISHINGYLALEAGPIAYAMALKETSTIFVFLISLIFLKESKNLKQKLVATLLAVAGAVLIAL